MCVTQRASQHVAARYYKLNRVTVPSELQKHVVSSVHHKLKKKKTIMLMVRIPFSPRQ